MKLDENSEIIFILCYSKLMIKTRMQQKKKTLFWNSSDLITLNL